MLVLSRKVGEQVQIGEHICVTIVRIGQNGIRIGVEAPPEYNIVRSELATESADGVRLEESPPPPPGQPR